MSAGVDRAYPEVVSLGVHDTPRGGSNAWHAHAFDELCLVADGETTIGHDGQPYPSRHGDLFLFRHGEQHRYVNAPRQSARLWVIHFEPGASCAETPEFDSPRAADRVWHLPAAQVKIFQDLFAKLEWEKQRARRGGRLAVAGILQVLLVELAQFREAQPSEGGALRSMDRELGALWRALHEHGGTPAACAAQLRTTFPNYDSLRHRFQSSFGCSPRQLAERIHMEKARHILLERAAPVAAIAAELGWNRQHEFTRAFTRAVGLSPARWRRLHLP